MIPEKHLSKEEQDKIIAKFDLIIPHLNCPMCKNSNFVMGDGYFNNVLQFHFNGIALSGPSIPTIPIICQNCGFISQHALKTIDLLPNNLNQK